MAGGDRRLRTSLAREPVRSANSLWPCRGILPDSRPPSRARAQRLRPAEAMKPSPDPKLAEVTPLRGEARTEVNPTVPVHVPDDAATGPVRSDLDAVGELAEAHAQILR